MSAAAAFFRWCRPASPTKPSTSSGARTTIAPRASASEARTPRASGSPPAPMTAGRPAFQIPAFSRAIDARSGPSTSWWSSATPVTNATAGSTTLVASSRPPRPTSSTTASRRSAAKVSNASSVASSKKVRSRSVAASAIAG